MINLGDAGQQKEMGGGPIPKGSLVKVKLEIRQPKKPDPQDPAVTIYNSGLKGLDCQLTVVSGQFEGVKIWENWFLPTSMQTIAMTKGQEGACNGSFAKCRAVIEAVRRLDPADPAANRNINGWFDLHGLEFPIKVGIDKPKPGDIYINNNVARVLTIQDEAFEQVMSGGDVVSDTPIPEIPQADKTRQSSPAQGWGQGQQQATGQQQAGGQQQGQEQPPQQQPMGQTPIPNWATGPAPQ